MFSACSINPQQFLVPLPHLVAAFNSLKSVSYKAVQLSCQSKKQAVETGFCDIDICTESLVQISKELRLEHLPKEWKSALLSVSNSKAENDITGLRESFISANSFFENKHGFPLCELHQSASFNQLLHRNLGGTFLQTPPNNQYGIGTQPYRGFRTKSPTGHKQLTSTGFTKVNDSSIQEFFSRLIPGKKQPNQFSDKVDHALSKHQDVVKDDVSFKTGFVEGHLMGKQDPAKPDRGSLIFRFLLAVVLLLIVREAIRPLSRGLSVQIDQSVEVTDTTFDDVQGIDEAKEELQHIVDYLKDPEKYTSLGGRLPKGILLVGRPGTGKTLLARAVAGEAGVRFFYVSGSDFDHMFVGSGAKKVRELFSAAKATAPCVVFIDELDSVGGKRTSNPLYPYSRQTINQLLAEMDGFRRNEGIIVLAASNFAESLDSALTRPGRFDTTVNVPLPDVKGREAILKLYMSKITMSADVDIDKVARSTVGFTGADIENLVNIAALQAAKLQKEGVDEEDFDFAMDKIRMGPARKSAAIDAKTMETTAFHEGGHAVVAYFTPNTNEINKATIMPRGPSLGHVSLVPDKDQWNVTKAQLLAQMDVFMAGRVAEEIIYGLDKVTTGASSDFKQATGIATEMVTKYGMSEKLGYMVYDEETTSPETKAVIDTEIKKLLKDSYERAKHILQTHSREHRLLAEALLQYETLTADEIKMVIEGKQLKR